MKIKTQSGLLYNALSGLTGDYVTFIANGDIRLYSKDEYGALGEAILIGGCYESGSATVDRALLAEYVRLYSKFDEVSIAAPTQESIDTLNTLSEFDHAESYCWQRDNELVFHEHDEALYYPRRRNKEWSDPKTYHDVPITVSTPYDRARFKQYKDAEIIASDLTFLPLFSIDAKSFLTAWRSLIVEPHDSNRPAAQCVLFILKAGELQMVSTNGYMVYEKTTPLEYEGAEQRFLIHYHEATRAIKKLSSEGVLEFGGSPALIRIDSAAQAVIVSRQQYPYMAYETVMQQPPYCVRFSIQDMVPVLKSMKAVCGDRKSTPLKIRVVPGQIGSMEMVAQTKAKGDQTGIFSIHYQHGVDCTLHIDGKYLLQFLPDYKPPKMKKNGSVKYTPPTEVSLFFSDVPKTPIMLYRSDTHERAVIMPMNAV